MALFSEWSPDRDVQRITQSVLVDGNLIITDSKVKIITQIFSVYLFGFLLFELSGFSFYHFDLENHKDNCIRLYNTEITN